MVTRAATSTIHLGRNRGRDEVEGRTASEGDAVHAREYLVTA
jgi:hypothetical protein